jgi:hypothetical protein
LKNSSWRKGFLVVVATCSGQPWVSQDDPGSIQAAITTAFRAGQKQIRIPPGAYRISPPQSGPHLLFKNFSDFIIDAAGVELIFTDRTRGGIEFRDCSNVTISGVSVRFEVPPFTQGVVEAVSPAGDWYDVRIDVGYPADFDDPRYFPAAPFGSLFDPKSRKIRPDAFDLSELRIERRGPDLFRLFRNPPSGGGVQSVTPGDLVAFRGSGEHNISVLNSTGVRLEGVTVYNSPAFAVFEADGEGLNHYRISVKPGPRPAGARSDPLFSSAADAFHSVNVRHGPVLENCHFESMGDDAIAIHGTYSLVLQSDGTRLIVSKGSFRQGDPIRLWDLQDRPAGETVVKAIRPLRSIANARRSQRDTRTDNSTGPYFEITLAHSVSAAYDYLASNPEAEGSGFILRNNTIWNHRARGMLLKADNGLVEDNTIDGSTIGGIVVTPEFWWNEADYSRNVIIRNNTIRNVARAPYSLGGMVVAAIDHMPVPACGHRDIKITGNRFENIDGVNLLITSACGIRVENNRFVRAQQHARANAGAAWGEDPTALIFVTKAQAVRLKGNQAWEPGPFSKRLVRAVP